MGRYGLSGCSIKAITSRAGVSRGLIHHYYRNKDELLCDAYRTLGEEMLTVFRRAAAEQTTPMARLEAVLCASFRPPVSTATTTSAWLGFWHAARSNPRLRAINQVIYDDYRALLEELVHDAGVELDSEADTCEVVSTLINLMDGAWIHLAIDPNSDTQESTIQSYVRLVLGWTDARHKECT